MDHGDLVEKLKKVKLLQSLDVASLNEVAKHFDETEFGPHERIIRQGDFGDTFYVLVQGEVEVYVNGNHITILPEGSFFGEQALLTNAPRNASVVASADGCKCLQMARSNFEAYLGPLRALMDQVNQQRKMLLRRKKLKKSKIGARLAALEKVMNPELAAKLDAIEHAEAKKRDDSSTNNNNKTKDTLETKTGFGVGTSSHQEESDDEPEEDRWALAFDEEQQRRKEVAEANAELLLGTAMAKQSGSTLPAHLVQEALVAGTGTLLQTAVGVNQFNWVQCS